MPKNKALFIHGKNLTGVPALNHTEISCHMPGKYRKTFIHYELKFS
jgi:hypothetical protein